MIQIPNNQIWQKANNSDLFGTIYITKNVTFDDEGYLSLSYAQKTAIDESIDSDFALGISIIKGQDYEYFIGTSDDAFEMSDEILDERPVQITDSGVTSPGFYGDAKYVGGILVVASNTDVDYYTDSTNTWTDTNISLTSSVQHPIESFLSLSLIAIANDNTVRLYISPLTATPTLVRTLTIPTDFEITAIRYFNQNLYIATNNVTGGHAFMFVWNGLGSAAQSAYEVDSNLMFNLVVYKDSIVTLSGSGALLRFNGSGFTMMDAFPIYYTDMSLSGDGNPQIFKNTIQSSTELLFIAFANSINDSNPDGTLTNQPDGVWCYDENVGLYQRYSSTNSLVVNQTVIQANVNTTTNQITVTSAPVTGTEVIFTEVFGLAPLVDGNIYYVININSTTIKLAETYQDAIDGNAIDLTSAGSTNRLTFCPEIDYGQFYSGRANALTLIERPVQNRVYGTEAIWATEAYRRNNTGLYDSLHVAARHLYNRGYFVTPKILGSDVTSDYNTFTLKYRPLLNERDKIIVKYRLEDDNRDFISYEDWGITWTSSTTFTTTQEKWSEAKEAFDNSKKYEVEILTGAGAGILAHIENITESGGTYTVTLDETYANYTSGDIGKAIFRNYVKFATIEYGSSDGESGYIEKQIGEKGKFIQFKIELRGKGQEVKIEQLLVDDIYRLSAFTR